MVEVIGKIRETRVEGDKLLDTWRVPAQAERLARRKVKTNATIKGREGLEIQSVEKIGEGSLPFQSIYEIVTSSQR